LGLGKIVRDPAAKARIVEAAGTVVAERGVHGASVRVIAERAGVSTGFITHYFADKGELMQSVLRSTNLAAAARLNAAIESCPTAVAALRAAMEAVLPLDPTRRREWQIWVAAWGEASQGDSLARGYREGWSGLRGILAEQLRRAQEQGELDSGIEVEHQAQRLATLLAGIGLLAGVERPGRVREEAARMIDEELARLSGGRLLGAAA
jgi:AcrR family transcriptional regulator